MPSGDRGTSRPRRRPKVGKEPPILAVVGLGRIGLPTAALFADSGSRVRGFDVDPRVVADTNAGICRFTDEPGLGELVEKNVRNGRLTATTSGKEAITMADFIVLCLPTPVDSTRTPDYSAVSRAASEVGKWMKKGCTVITESTVGPGIVESMIGPALEKESGLRTPQDFGLASCPERSDPGHILADMKSVPRIVGSTSDVCTEGVVRLYEDAFSVKAIRVSSPRTANAVKLTENIFRDVNIALSNEFAMLFEKLGVDAKEVIDACATKYNFVAHYPGAGVGGPCLPSNSYYMVAEGMKVGNIPYIVRMGREINDRMPDHVVELASEALNEAGRTVKGSKIAILGITYKPDIKDVQLSPVITIAKRLEEMGAKITVYDPMYRGESVAGFSVARDLSGATAGAHCLVLGTAHAEFKKLDLPFIKKIMSGSPAFVDARNVVGPQEASAAGFVYSGVGRKLMPLRSPPKN